MEKSDMTYALSSKIRGEKSTNLGRSEHPHPPRFSASERVDAVVAELRWAIRAPCNHELNVQKQTNETNSLLPTPAFSLSFVASRRTNENTNSNGKIGHDPCLFEQNQVEKRAQTVVEAEIRVFPKLAASLAQLVVE